MLAAMLTTATISKAFNQNKIAADTGANSNGAVAGNANGASISGSTIGSSGVSDSDDRAGSVGSSRPASPDYDRAWDAAGATLVQAVPHLCSIVRALAEMGLPNRTKTFCTKFVESFELTLLLLEPFDSSSLMAAVDEGMRLCPLLHQLDGLSYRTGNNGTGTLTCIMAHGCTVTARAPDAVSHFYYLLPPGQPFG
jgi:hypothetical protein